MSKSPQYYLKITVLALLGHTLLLGLEANNDNPVQRDIPAEILEIRKSHPVLADMPVYLREELSKLYQMEGEILNQKEHYVYAAIHFRKAMILHPANQELLFKAGLSYSKASRHSIAARLLEDFHQRSADETLKFEAARTLYKVYQELGKQEAKISLWDSAIEYFNLALKYSQSTRSSMELVDQIQTAYFKQGTFHYSQKHFLEAARNFLHALSRNTRESLRAKIERIGLHLFMNAGKHYEKSNLPHEAKPYFEAISNFFHSESAVRYARKRLKAMESNEIPANTAPPDWLIQE